MFKTMFTLFRASSTAGEEAIIDANAVILLQQHIKDAEQAIEGTKRALATLLKEKKTLAVANEKLAEKEALHRSDAEKALELDKEELALMAAEMLADCQVKRDSNSSRLDKLEVQIAKLRHKIESHQDRLAELKIGLQKAKFNQQDSYVLNLICPETKRTSS